VTVDDQLAARRRAALVKILCLWNRQLLADILRTRCCIRGSHTTYNQILVFQLVLPESQNGPSVLLEKSINQFISLLISLDLLDPKLKK
jgi:hypothetical protein